MNIILINSTISGVSRGGALGAEAPRTREPRKKKEEEKKKEKERKKERKEEREGNKKSRWQRKIYESPHPAKWI